MITVNLTVNGTQAFTSENVIMGTFSLNRYSTTAVAPEFGNVSAGELLFSIDTTTVTPNIKRGDIVSGTWSDGTTTTAIGEFVVTNIVRADDEIDVTCLDKMILLDGEADLTGVTYPLTAEAFINAIYRDGLGLTVSIANNVNKTVSLGDPLFEMGITYRQVLSKVCECMGANAWYSDRLMIGFYKANATAVDDEVYTVADLTDNAFSVDVEVTNDLVAKPVELEDNKIILRVVANPFLANYTEAQRTTLANTIKANIGNVSWYGGNVTILPDPTLTIMDVIPVTTPDNVTHSFPITSITYGINENTKLVAKIDSADNDYNYSTARDIAVLKREVTETMENNKHFFYRDDSGVHITMVENDYNTGNNIHIDSDSVDVREGTTVVARFGKPSVVGDTNDTHLEMDFNALRLIDKEGNEYFIVEDLRNEQGFANLTIETEGDGSRKEFRIDPLADDTNYVVKLDGAVVTTGITKRRYSVLFSAAPPAGSVITIAFTTSSEDAKTLKFGRITASGYALSSAFGVGCQANGYASHAEGRGTTASGLTSHAEGELTTASGYYSHAEGNGTTASGNNSHAEGIDTTASGVISHAEGFGTTASGYASHTEGRNTTAKAWCSHAQNEGTIATDASQTAIGRYNEEIKKVAFVLGNGTDDTNRSNALTIDWSGNVKSGGQFFDTYYEIPQNADLNDIQYCKPGRHQCPSSAWAQTLTNCPTTSAFEMNVWVLSDRDVNTYTGNLYIVQEIHSYNNRTTYMRYVQRVSNTWTYSVWRGSTTFNTNYVNDAYIDARIDLSPAQRVRTWVADTNGDYYVFIADDNGAYLYDNTNSQTVWRTYDNLYVMAGNSTAITLGTTTATPTLQSIHRVGGNRGFEIVNGKIKCNFSGNVEITGGLQITGGCQSGDRVSANWTRDRNGTKTSGHSHYITMGGTYGFISFVPAVQTVQAGDVFDISVTNWTADRGNVTANAVKLVLKYLNP